MPTEAKLRGSSRVWSWPDCWRRMSLLPARADAEEGQVVALRVGNEVAAGVSYAVYFMEGVGEVGDARRTHWTTVLEVYPHPRQKYAKSTNDGS